MFLLQTESITNLSGYSESPGKKNYFWKRSCLQSFSHFLTEKAFGAECPLIPLAFEDSKITSHSGIIFEVTCISIKCRSKELTLTWEKSSLQEYPLQQTLLVLNSYTTSLYKTHHRHTHGESRPNFLTLLIIWMISPSLKLSSSFEPS